MTTGTFEDEFKDRLSKLEKEAHLVGLNLTSICKEAGFSRATPDRWKRETPKTVAMLSKMEAIVAERKAKTPAAPQ